MDKLSEDNRWLLSKIEALENFGTWRRWPYHRNIWQGCYDVWFCEQDKIDAVEIPKRRMKEAEDAGLITSEEREQPSGHKHIVWKLTDLGEKLLENSGGGWL